MNEKDTNCEVWFGRKWCPARVTETRNNGDIRAVVPSSGITRDLRFGKREVRFTSPGTDER